MTVAEKFDAMVKLDIRNSRMKDFHDIWALSGGFSFDGAALQRAVVACFKRRGTAWSPEMPRPLTAPFYATGDIAARWRHYLGAGAVLVAPPTQFEDVGERIIGFLAPLRNSIVNGEQFARTWPPEGPWR